MEKKWREKEGDNNFYCTFPGCSYKNVSKRAVAGHYTRMHTTGGATGQKLEECKHNYRLLSIGEPRELLAIDAGYVAVCLTCGEVK